MSTAPQIRILLVEDHLLVREGTRQLLEREEDLVIVGEASDGEKAVLLANQLKPDVVIMDISLPKISGIEATKQIKAQLPSTIILALTGYDYDEYIISLLEAGAAGYLLKDVSGDNLVSAIRQVFVGEQVLHPRVVRKLVSYLTSHTTEPASTPIERKAGELLSERELEVLKKAAKGMSNREIAEGLFISTRTVQAHMRSIFNKLGLGSRAEAILYGLKRGWFSMDDLP